MSKRFTNALASLALAGPGLLALAGPSAAATVCVNPANASCQPTVQSGIAAASAGDTVSIAKGFYNENVTVPVGKDGLVIRGGRTAVLDGDAPLTGVTLTIDSDDVTVQGLTFRNGNQAAIVSTGNGTVIRGVTVTGPDGDCIQLNGDGSTVERSLLNGCGDNAIDVNADDVVIARNKIFHCDESCIDIAGDGAVVERNTTQITEDAFMIDLAGDNAEIVGNKLDNAEAELIFASGDNLLIQGNRLTHGFAAFDVGGTNPVIVKNRAQHLHGGTDGMRIVCNTDCTTGMVVGNRLEDASNDTGGISVTGNAVGMTATGNAVARTEEFGFEIFGSASVAFDKNKIARAGADNGTSCIQVQGTGGHVVTNNRAADCHGDGIRVTGTGHTIAGNRIKDLISNGIHLVSGSGHTVDQNRVQNANGSGLAVESATTNSSADGNAVKRVRSGLCRNSASTTVTNHAVSQADKADEILAGACPI